MNFIPSLILYNPLEAIVIILLLCFASKSKLSFGRLIANSYILGTLNLIFQFICELMYGSKYYPFITIFMQYLVSPLIIFAYFSMILRVKIGIMKTFVLKVLFTLSVNLIISILIKFDVLDVFATHFEFAQEFLINMSVRIPQFVFIGLLHLRKKLTGYERVFEKVG